MKNFGLFFLILLIAGCVAGKRSADESGIYLKQAAFSQLQGFEHDNISEAAQAFELSCESVQKNPKILEKGEIKINSQAYLNVCEKFKRLKVKNDDVLRAFFKTNLVLWYV